MKKQLTSYPIYIDAFSKKGNGLGICDKPPKQPFQLEVPFAVPKDTLLASLCSSSKRLKKGKIQEIVTPSPLRIHPKCAHFGVCGGCKLQQVSYETQASFKQDLLFKTFSPLLPQGLTIPPLLPSPAPFYYRNKMEFSFSSDKEGKKYLGLMMEGGKGRVLTLQECHLTSAWFIQALKTTLAWWKESSLEAYHPYKNRGALRTLTLREGFRSKDRLVMLTVSGNPEDALKKGDIERFVSFLRAAIDPFLEGGELSIFLRIHQAQKGIPTQFYEMHLFGPDHIKEELYVQIDPKTPPIALKFQISPTAFFQPNPLQAEKLYSKALQLAEIPKNGVVYDLYCGTGTLGICSALKAKEVISIELSAEASLDAKANAALNHLNNLTIYTGEVQTVLKTIKEERKHPLPDLVLVDPPRTGLLPQALEEIEALKAKKVLYISCQPETQAKDVAKMLEKGYQIEAIQPVDQFPQTYHLENIVVLKRI